MIIRSLFIAAVLVAFSAPASALYCPKQGKAINASPAYGKLSSANKAEVDKLRDAGLALHGSGDHTGAMKSLAAATRIVLGGGM